ncbi:MAG: alpha/beta hydrolase [Frankiaceae bacterium]|nr:alpha/beta hydrolase [Arenimonas sp.]
MGLNPQIGEMFAAMVKAGRPAISAGSPKDARGLTSASRAALGPGPEMTEVRELSLPTRSGSIGARLLLPSNKVDGLMVYFHGGGWVVGELDDYDSMARTLAKRSNCAMLLPDYRLAPEHPFPAALEDTEDVIMWASQRIKELAGSSVPFLVGGDSAGGNLATVAVRDLGKRVPVTGQLLIYPVTDCDTDNASYRSQSDGMQLTRSDMQWFFRQYAPAERHADPRISPLRHQALGHLPPTVVITAACDVLRDEGEAYAQRLVAAGVSVTARRVAGLPHGFIRLHNLVAAADEAVTEIAADIARLCKSPPFVNQQPV